MNELIEVLKEITELLQQYLPLEQDKLNAVKEGRVSFLDDCMMKEQALLLKMRGLEKKREQELEKCGYTGLSLSEIICKLPEESKESMRLVAQEFTTSVKQFTALNDEALKLIRIHVHEIEKVKQMKEGHTYGKPHGEIQELNSITNQII